MYYRCKKITWNNGFQRISHFKKYLYFQIFLIEVKLEGYNFRFLQNMLPHCNQHYNTSITFHHNILNYFCFWFSLSSSFYFPFKDPFAFWKPNFCGQYMMTSFSLVYSLHLLYSDMEKYSLSYYCQFYLTLCYPSPFRFLQNVRFYFL